MKTFKLVMNKDEIDFSSYKTTKFPTKENIIIELATKLKKPLSVIKKRKYYVNAFYEKRMNLFIDTKIVIDNTHIIESVIGYETNKLNRRYIDFNINGRDNFNGWQHKTKYNFETKTVNRTLSYKNRIQYEIQNIKSINRERKKESIKEMVNLPKFIQHWMSKEGKKEIELIEKSLEQLGKIKFEIYNQKSKKIDTFYVKYKRINKPYIAEENIEQISKDINKFVSSKLESSNGKLKRIFKILK